MNAVAIIPARGGSKRIPRKNIKDFLGKPAIAYSIEAARNSNLFAEVMVSTEDEEIAEISRKYGAKVPFLRSMRNADDFTGTGDVVFEVLQEYSKDGHNYEVACCIYATSPLLSAARIKQGYELFENGGFDVVFPVGKYSSSIWRSYTLSAEMGAKLNFPEYHDKRSQDIADAYYDAGQFYWFRTENMATLTNKNTFGLNKGAIVLNDLEVQDIDNMDDWRMAELKYKMLNNI